MMIYLQTPFSYTHKSNSKRYRSDECGWQIHTTQQQNELHIHETIFTKLEVLLLKIDMIGMIHPMARTFFATHQFRKSEQNKCIVVKHIPKILELKQFQTEKVSKSLYKKCNDD